jgi:hypothetical protein
MEGRARAAKREAEAMLSQAWHTEAFARQKHLKPLDKILAKRKPRRVQSPEEMLAILMQCQAGGAPLTIREIN